MSWELQTSFLLGVIHSLEPGHGKTAMVAMMLDPSKKWMDSFLLATSAVFSHSAFIFVVAGLTHLGGHLLFKEKLDDMLTGSLHVMGPLSLVLIGLFLIRRSKVKHHNCCDSKKNRNLSESKIPILLGLSIGLYPCPTLLASYLASISSGQLSLGVFAIGVFSLGSFLTLVVSGLILKWVGRSFAKNYEAKLSHLNWRRLQGVLLIIIGMISFFAQDHH